MFKYMLCLAIDLFFILSFLSFLMLEIKEDDRVGIVISSILISINVVALGYHFYMMKGLL